MWYLAWLALLLGGMAIGAAIYLAVSSHEQNLEETATPPVIAIPSVLPTKHVASTVLLQSRAMNAQQRQQLARLLKLLAVEFGEGTPLRHLHHPDSYGDGPIAIVQSDERFWLQLPGIAGPLPLSGKDEPAHAEKLIFAETEDWISGHVPENVWRTLLPPASVQGCLLHDQLMNQLQGEAQLRVSAQPLSLQLSWPIGAPFGSSTETDGRKLPEFIPSKNDVLYSAALGTNTGSNTGINTGTNSNCLLGQRVMRLWQDPKQQMHLFLHDAEPQPEQSAIEGLSLPMQYLNDDKRSQASSTTAASWWHNLKRDESGLIFESYLAPEQLAAIASPSNKNNDNNRDNAGPPVHIRIRVQQQLITLDMSWY